MQRWLFLSSADSDKFIVTFILNPFDPPSSLRILVSFSRRDSVPISQAVPRYFGVLRWIVSLLNELAPTENRAHRRPTRKEALTCNAEMGSEVGSHVYSIGERPGNVDGITYKSDALEEVSSAKKAEMCNKPLLPPRERQLFYER